jgi:transcriptional regulator with XRE-family HTH domain
MPRHPQNHALLQRFGARVREVREARRVTQQHLSEMLSMRASSVSQIETGDLSPTLTTVAAIARAMGVRPAELLDFDVAVSAEPAGLEEVELLSGFRGLPADRKALVLLVVKAMMPGAAAP